MHDGNTSLKLFLICVVYLYSFLLKSQNDTITADTTYWNKGMTNTLTFSQITFSNWASGGKNSITMNANTQSFFNLITPRAKWENFIEMGYGLTNQGSTGFKKSDDKINFIMKYSYKINKNAKKWYFSTLFNFKTQFDKGFDAKDDQKLISDFMAPGYLIIGAGIDYYYDDFLSFSYIVLTGKFTFVLHQSLADSGAYGVTPAVLDKNQNKIQDGKPILYELGSFFRIKYHKDHFESRLELFTNYLNNIGNIDVNWQNSLVVNVTQFISVNIFTQLIYDDDIKIGADDNGDGKIDTKAEVKPRIQLKAITGIGLVYRL